MKSSYYLVRVACSDKKEVKSTTMKYCEIVVAFLAIAGGLGEGKTFRTCELARALANEGVPRLLISNCKLTC